MIAPPPTEGRSVGRSVCATPAQLKLHGPLNASILRHERVGAAELPSFGRALLVPTEIVSHAARRAVANRSRPSVELVRVVAACCGRDLGALGPARVGASRGRPLPLVPKGHIAPVQICQFGFRYSVGCGLGGASPLLLSAGS